MLKTPLELAEDLVNAHTLPNYLEKTYRDIGSGYYIGEHRGGIPVFYMDVFLGWWVKGLNGTRLFLPEGHVTLPGWVRTYLNNHV